MSYTLTPVTEKDRQKSKTTLIEDVLENLLPEKGGTNRPLTNDELWMIGLMMWKIGSLFRFKIKGPKGDIVRIGYPQ